MSTEELPRENPAEVRRQTGIYSLHLPPDPALCDAAIKACAQKDKPVEELATLTAQDMAIVLDLIKASNQMEVAGARAKIISTKAAIIRLGNVETAKVLKKLLEVQQPETAEEQYLLRKIRYRALRIAITSQMIAETISQAHSDDCYTAGLLTPAGELLGLIYLREKYVTTWQGKSRAQGMFSLVKDLKFDPIKFRNDFLKRFGLPEQILSIIAVDGTTPPKDRAILPIIVNAAEELVDAFDTDKFDRYAPGKPLPPRSPVRALSFGAGQYSKVYERLTELYFSLRKKWQRDNDEIEAPPPATEQDSPAQETTPVTIQPEQVVRGAQLTEQAEAELADEISNLLKSFAAPPPKEPEAPKRQPVAAPSFSSLPASEQASRASQALRRLDRAKQLLSSASNTLNAAKSSEEAISSILDLLINGGSFKRTALLVVSDDKAKATVVASRGSELGKERTIIIEDPMSPLVQAFSQVQSFGIKESEVSPFGSKSFAIAPLAIKHPNPVALYADAGDDPISFEGRRLFREVLSLLSAKLPTLPGSLPSM